MDAFMEFKKEFLELMENKQYSRAREVAETNYKNGVIDVDTLVTAMVRIKWGEEKPKFDEEFVDWLLWGGKI